MDITLNPVSTALVLIDFQRSNVARQLVPHDSGTIVQNAAKLVHAFRSRGSLIVFVHVLVTELLELTVDLPFPKGSSAPPPNASEIVEEVGFQTGDHLVAKRQWGAFYGTELDQLLRRHRTQTIVLAGIATNFGVESTARAAADKGYELVFAEDAMSSVDAEAHAFSVTRLFPRIGRVRSTADLLKTL